MQNNQSAGCLFCETPAHGEDEKALIVWRGRSIFIQMNLYPYNPGHIMIVPYRHLAALDDLSADEQVELIKEVARSTAIMREAMNTDGFNVGINQGRAAGAGVDQHLHVHVVPRWSGDTNFMPVTAGTKVIPEGLTATYRKLAPLFSTAAHKER